MFDSALIPLAHEFVRWLLVPTIGLLLALVALALWEVGQVIGERLAGLRRLRERGSLDAVEAYGRRRIERADVLARVAPMLGLMGTLIPLGPGIAALSRGEFEILARAVSVAFDTTVIGLAVGIVGFIIGRLRRRWYDRVMGEIEAANGDHHAAA
ncbi:MotA/TolQ/ExbB proton channel family protein [Halofilum ochraceum]|uniref:MotA/TolQ/ExbB proton channel family protein n=1 Tax=Halofilum ochraceum TaxID=1611323 RepID=UPI0008DA34F5|nr:MotA/TolQ/ExbB proton channel family protein [Halofilum ochraceum]